MSADSLRTRPSATLRLLEDAYEADSRTQERLMLLELAADLENWPARNLVFRTALDRAAHDLVRLAGQAEAEPPPAQPG